MNSATAQNHSCSTSPGSQHHSALQLPKQFMVDTSKFTGKGEAQNNLYAGTMSYEVEPALVLGFTRGRAKN